MKKYFLEVPEFQNDKVKALGAEWDTKEKKWFISSQLNKEVFKKWIPNYPSGRIVILKTPIYLVKTWESCHECGYTTDVFCIGSQGIIDDTLNIDKFFTIYDVSYVQEPLLEFLRVYAPSYYFACAAESDAMYMLNHCSKCNSTQNERDLHHPEGPFLPMTQENAEEVSLYELPVINNVGINGIYSSSDIDLIYHCAKRESLNKLSSLLKKC